MTKTSLGSLIKMIYSRETKSSRGVYMALASLVSIHAKKSFLLNLGGKCTIKTLQCSGTKAVFSYCSYLDSGLPQ